MSYGAPHTPSNGGGGASSDPAAALRGASLAFSKKKPPAPPPTTKTNNGALTAATLSAQSTGASGLPDIDSAASRSIVTARLQQLGASQPHQQQQYQQQHHGGNTHLQPPGPGKVDPKSPSFIAATLAASRSGSPNSKALTPKRKTSSGTLNSISVGDAAVDSGSIPPTGSLISIFEGGSAGDPVKKTPRRKLSTDTLTPKKEKKERQDAPRSPVAQASHGQMVRPGGLEEATPPRLKHLISQDTGELRRAEARTTSPSPPRQSSVPKITNKYSKTNMRASTPPPQPSFESQSRQPTPRSSHKRTKSRPDPIGRPPTPPESRVSVPILEPPRVPPKIRDVVPKESLQGVRQAPKSPPVVPQLEPLSHRREKRNERQMTTGANSQAPPAPPKPKSHMSTPNLRQDAGIFRQNSAAVTKSKPDRGPAPAPPKPRGSSKLSEVPIVSPEPTVLHRVKTTDTVSSNDVFVSAPTSPETVTSPPPLPRRNRASTSGPPSPTRSVGRTRSTTATSANNQALDSLTSAIVAGSLAASRLTPSNTGTSLPPPSSTPIRQKSPRLRQTLRGPVDSSDEEDDKYKKTHHHRPKLRSGKHAHHEGARKRWRDEVRPRERKRYEAVWASNRGIHLPNASSPAASSASSSDREPVTDYANSVANVVVREVWKRSRLPEDELVEVWELVDRNKRGMLDRQEFVVGMWLIDQRLKGRKIPTKVSQSVWGSANGNGLMVMRPKGK